MILTIRVAALMLRLHEANAEAISDALERDGSAARISKNSAAFIIAETQHTIAWQLYNILAECCPGALGGSDEKTVSEVRENGRRPPKQVWQSIARDT